MSGRVGEITVGRDDVRLEASGLHLPENMPLEDWRRVGERLRDTQQSLMWWVGDWLRFGEHKHGVTYAEAAELTGYKEQSLRTAVWLSGQFDVSMRINKLTWNHHRHAASLPPDKRSEALQRAADEGLSTRALKALISDMKQADAPAPKTDVQPNQSAPKPPQTGPEASTATEVAPAPEAAQRPEPEPEDPVKAKLRAQFRRLTPEAQEEDWIGLRLDLNDEKAKRKKAEREKRYLKERLKEHTSDKDESIRRQAAQIKHQCSELERANQKFTAEKNKNYALNKRIKELEQMGVPL